MTKAQVAQKRTRLTKTGRDRDGHSESRTSCLTWVTPQGMGQRCHPRHIPMTHLCLDMPNNLGCSDISSHPWPYTPTSALTPNNITDCRCFKAHQKWSVYSRMDFMTCKIFGLIINRVTFYSWCSCLLHAHRGWLRGNRTHSKKVLS